MQRKIIVPNLELLDDVRSMIDSGERVILRTKGQSMLPFIVGGRDSVELTSTNGVVEVGDIILAKISQPKLRYVIHRVVDLEGDRVTLMGDGNLVGTEQCRPEDVVARVTAIITPKRSVDPNTLRSRRYAALWQRLRPVRRYLLAILRRVL